MGGHSVPLWQRLWLPRGGVVANRAVEVPLSYAVVPQPRGVRVVYRFPPLTRAQALFIVQLQSFKDSLGTRSEKRMRRCDSLPGSCNTWFADQPGNRIKCTERAFDQDGYFGFCWPTSGPVYAIYGCESHHCNAAREILTRYYNTPGLNVTPPAPDG